MLAASLRVHVRRIPPSLLYFFHVRANFSSSASVADEEDVAYSATALVASALTTLETRPVQTSGINSISSSGKTDDDALSTSGAVGAAAAVEKTRAALAARVAAHREAMRSIEASREWRDYDSHVAFELLVLKHRYSTSAGAPMTTARRAQMAAHLRAKQAEIMDAHAEAASEDFLQGLAPADRAALARRLLRIEATPENTAKTAAAAVAAADEALSTNPTAMQDALDTLAKDFGRPAAVGERALRGSSVASGRQTFADLEKMRGGAVNDRS